MSIEVIFLLLLSNLMFRKHGLCKFSSMEFILSFCVLKYENFVCCINGNEKKNMCLNVFYYTLKSTIR